MATARKPKKHMRDPYSVLGISKTASGRDIKSAYRKLAKSLHPDQNPDNPKAHDKFAEVTSAYDFLSDTAKRAQYDRGEIDATGNPKMAGFDFNNMGGRGHGAAGATPEDILKEFMAGFGGTGGGQRRGPAPGAGWDPFGGTTGARQQTQRTKGNDIQATARVTLEAAHTAGSVSVKLPGGRTVSVKLPKDVTEGQQIRLKGQGQASLSGGEPGDAIVTIKFAKHKQFRVEGNDVWVDVPLALYEAVLGAKVRIPTLGGEVELNLPAGVETAKSLRLKGKGFQGKGNLFVNLRIVLPEGGDADLESLMRFWRDQKPYSVRR